jgi:hypothetical protein
MIREDQKVYLVRVQDTQAKPHIVYPELRTKKVMLVLVESWNNNLLKVRTWVIVATRLQARYPSFQLRTSSNTSSVETSVVVGFLGQFQWTWRFPSCNSWLQKRLGEPDTIQDKIAICVAHQPIKNEPVIDFPTPQGDTSYKELENHAELYTTAAVSIMWRSVQPHE